MSHTQSEISQSNGKALVSTSSPEVVVKAERRRFTAEYKLHVLEEADACRQPGEVGALLRREGLYSSHLTTWRQQRDRGALQGLTPAKRGRKSDPQAAEVARLKRENEQLRAKLERAELIIDVQKKVSQMLGLPATESDEAR